MNQTSKVISVIALIVVIVAGFYIYKTIYPPIVAPINPEVETIKQEVIKDRVVIKEVVRDAKKQAVAAVEALSDDAVANELNSRLGQYRKSRGQATE